MLILHKRTDKKNKKFRTCSLEFYKSFPRNTFTNRWPVNPPLRNTRKHTHTRARTSSAGPRGRRRTLPPFPFSERSHTALRHVSLFLAKAAMTDCRIGRQSPKRQILGWLCGTKENREKYLRASIVIDFPSSHVRPRARPPAPPPPPPSPRHDRKHLDQNRRQGI